MSMHPLPPQPDILVVDDDPMSRDMLVYMFLSADIRVAAERDELERPAHRLCDTILDQARLTNARGARKQE